MDLHKNFTTNVSLDKEDSIKIWKSSGSGIRIRIRVGGSMRSPRTLICYLIYPLDRTVTSDGLRDIMIVLLL